MVKLSKFRSTTGLSVIAQPLASDKLLKKGYKIVKKACKDKLVRRGVKEVQKALRKEQKGVCFIAGDISPIDVVSHLPGMCEDKHIPYCFVPSKQLLGEACNSKRPTSCILIVPKLKDGKEWEHKESFDELVTKVNKIAPLI